MSEKFLRSPSTRWDRIVSILKEVDPDRVVDASHIVERARKNNISDVEMFTIFNLRYQEHEERVISDVLNLNILMDVWLSWLRKTFSGLSSSGSMKRGKSDCSLPHSEPLDSRSRNRTMSPLGSEDNSPFLDLAGFPPSGECSLDFLRDGTVLCTTIERAVEMARQRYADSGFPVLSDYDSHFPSFEKEQRLSPTVKNQSGLFFDIQMKSKVKKQQSVVKETSQSLNDIMKRFEHFNLLCREYLDWKKKDKQGSDALTWNSHEFVLNPTNNDDLYVIKRLHMFAIFLFIKIGDPTIVPIPPRVSFILTNTIPESAGVDASEEDSEFAILVATKCSCLPHHHKLRIRVPKKNVLEISHPTAHSEPLTFLGTIVGSEAFVFLERTKTFVSLCTLLRRYLKLWDNVKWYFELTGDEAKVEEILFGPKVAVGSSNRLSTKQSQFSSGTPTFELRISTVVSDNGAEGDITKVDPQTVTPVSISAPEPKYTVPFSTATRRRQVPPVALQGNRSDSVGSVTRQHVGFLHSGELEESFVEEQLTPLLDDSQGGFSVRNNVKNFCATVVNDLDSKLAVRQHRFRLSGKAIGIGAFGAVFRALDLETGAFVAVKQSRYAYGGNEFNLNQREFEMWSMLPSHPHVISFYGACKEVETNQLLLVLEYASGGSIVSMYQDFRPIPDHLFLRHAKGVALGLKHLHDHNVIHGDVKAENVLTRTDGSVAISDFGCSRLPTANSVVPSFTVRAHEAEGAPLFGTAAYMAPEVIMNESHCKSDVWAYACMLIYLWTGALPWSKVADHITCYDTIPLMFFIANEEKIPFTEEELETVPRWLQKVAARAFVRDVANRCTMTEVLTLIAEYEPITR